MDVGDDGAVVAVVGKAVVDCGGEEAAVAGVEKEDAEDEEGGEEGELEGGADYAAGHGGMRGRGELRR